jgi:hypothetical protein
MMTRPVKKQITIKDIPITDDMRKQFEFNRDPIEDYAKDFTYKLTAMENYDAFKAYLLANGMKFETPKKKLRWHLRGIWRNMKSIKRI